jgi:formylglycine-generating enzyme required for sulfatase activity
MVDVRGAFCIDRFEAVLVDARTGKRLSPYYHPTAGITRREYERWQRLRAEQPTDEGKALPVPAPDEWELDPGVRFEPKATVLPDAIPNGYLSGEIAERACRNAGKRLCTAEEWVTACRGEQGRKFPYGDTYEPGRCNVHRETHPARVLHGDASIGHLDPRLNQVTEENGDPLLRQTGGTPSCKSEWNGDAAYDMVGNLDEWIDDPDGTFVGGFYSRATKEGCDSRIEVHSYDYYDYSLGVRCCRSGGGS